MSYTSLKPGDLIIRSPYTEQDLVYHKSVILIITHNASGTSGVIINKVLSKMDTKDILHGFIENTKVTNPEDLKKNELSSKSKINKFFLDLMELDQDIIKENELKIIFGGPVEPERGFMIHSNDYINKRAIQISADLSMSADTKILVDIILGKGPENGFLCLGYCSWQASQIIEEIKNNEWIILSSQENEASSNNFDLIFSDDHLYQWNRAIKIAGIKLSHYSNQSSQA